MSETPAELAARLSLSVSALTGETVGAAECGCPNNYLGERPVLHLCFVCGHTGNVDIHEHCSGCAYLAGGGTERNSILSPEYRLWGPSERGNERWEEGWVREQ